MKKIFALALALSLSLSLAACGNNSSSGSGTTPPPADNSSSADKSGGTTTTPAPANNVTLKLGFSTNEEDPRALGAKQFKEEVESKTNGAVRPNQVPVDIALVTADIDAFCDLRYLIPGNGG
ncbi:MAG: hypothetical protein HFF47_03130, partial [Lawsonibacter sp.]|nr:hypothetical protein [Lawsonibacter sp.]